MIKGFAEDDGVRRFYVTLLLSAIDEARQYPQQGHQPLNEHQINARLFLLDPDNRVMVHKIIEATGLNPDWFFERVLTRLIKEGWPAATQSPYRSRLNGKYSEQVFASLFEESIS